VPEQLSVRSGGLRGSAGTNLTRDVQYDMPWAMSDDGKPITYTLLNSETPGLTPAATTAVDWPRAAGIQTVNHPRDVRQARVRDLHRLVQSGQR
jgi:hypothetical protein